MGVIIGIIVGIIILGIASFFLLGSEREKRGDDIGQGDVEKIPESELQERVKE